MTGTPSHTSIRRLRDVGRTLFALGTALILVAVLAPIATAADNAFPSDDRATFHNGNFGYAAKNCATEYGTKYGTSSNNTAITTTVTPNATVTTTLGGNTVTYTGTQAVNVSANGVTVVAVIIKGGNGYNAYGPGVPNMINPLNNSGKPAGLSHWTVCYNDTTTTTADPAIVKTGPTSSVTAGNAYSFSLVVSNAGDSGSTTGTFTVSDTVPASAGNVTGVTSSGTGVDCSGSSGNVVDCDIPALGSSDSVTITVNVTAPTGTDVCGTFTNTASLTGVQGANDTSNDSSSDTVTIVGCGTTPRPDPAIQKDGPGQPVGVGSSYGFTMTVTNAGEPDSQTGTFTVTDDVPSEAGTVTDVSGTNGADCAASSGNAVSCQIPSLGTGDSVTITVTVTAPADGPNVCGPTHTNTAELSTAGVNTSTSNDSDDADVRFTGCSSPTSAVPTVDVEKLVSLSGNSNLVDADTAADGPRFALQNPQAQQQVRFRIVVTNTSTDGTVLTLNSLTDEVTSGDAEPLDLSDCTFPEGGLAAGASVTCDIGPLVAQVGLQHTNVVTVSATGADQVVLDSDAANYIGTRVAGVVTERPDPPPAPEPAPGPDVVAEPEPAAEADPAAEPEPAPEVLGVTHELPTTGPEDLWLAGLALMLLGAGLLTVARGKAMDAAAYATGTWWTSRRP